MTAESEPDISPELKQLAKKLFEGHPPKEVFPAIGAAFLEYTQEIFSNDFEIRHGSLNALIALNVIGECIDHDVMDDMETFIDRLRRGMEME